MKDIIDDVTKHPDRLREITLMGPLLPNGKKTWPFWILQAAAPSFGMRNAVDAKGKPTGTVADHAHPVRVLNTDPEPGKAGFLQPRLVSLHLLVGADNDRYHERGSQPSDTHKDRDRLLIGWTDGNDELRASYGAKMRTVTEFPDETKGQAPFVHVVAEVLPHGISDVTGQSRDEDGDAEAGDGAIALAPLRLVAGRVGLRVRPKAAPWLARLGVTGAGEDGGDWTKWPCIWLVPDGIEFDAELPFPGWAAGRPLTGRVLLRAETQSGQPVFRLHLITPGVPADWHAAWNAVTPPAESAESLQGLRFAARRDSRLPKFSWPVTLDSDGEPAPLPAGTVEVDADAVEITLASPPVLAAIDSTATLRPTFVKVSEEPRARNRIRFTFDVGQTTGAAMTWGCAPAALTFGATQAYSLDVDVDRLAVDLRRAYGIAEPPPVPSQAIPGCPAGTAYDRPMLPAFVPLENGWLQLPVPNFGPLDLAADQARLALPAPRPRNVLNGFLRLRQPGMNAQVQSAVAKNSPAFADSAPWSLTVERATGASGTIHVTADAAGGRLTTAAVRLFAPELSTRGLLWVSADRPDALEGLARLGAGPAAFLDVRMHSADGADAERAAIRANLQDLSITVTLDAASRPTPALSWSSIELMFRADHQRWVNELLKPAEARDALIAGGKAISTDFALTLPVAGSLGDSLAELTRGVSVVQEVAGQTAAGLEALSDTASTLARHAPLRPAMLEVNKQLAEAASSDKKMADSAAKIAAPLRDAHQALATAGKFQQHPWRSVAWLRHGCIPLAAEMPMTRAAGGSVRPLESRDLMPYAATYALAADGLVRLAVLTPSPHRPLLALAGDGPLKPALRPVAAWPAADGTSSGANPPVLTPQRGIAFAAACLPGAEFRVRADAAGKLVWEGALRYDLPLLDEAFACAALPPPAEPKQNAAPVAPPAVVPTALDWPQLARFWDEQERKHQNSRVADSYLCGFRPVTTTPANTDVHTLVKGLTWTTPLALDMAPGPLPYGTLTLAGHAPCNGNTALAGYSGPVPEQGPALVDLLGFSPASLRLPGIPVPLDNARSGAGTASLDAGKTLMSRPVWIAGQARRLVSLCAPAPAAINGELFDFWFKDVLFNGDAAQLDAAEAALHFDVWDNDATLAACGNEWRFAPQDKALARIALELGRNELPFFGFRLEPLRLLDVRLDQGRLASARLQCRLSLAPRSDADNLVMLDFTWPADGAPASVRCSLADAGRPLRFTVLACEQQDSQAATWRRVVVTATLPGPTLERTAERFTLNGMDFSLELADRPVRLGKPVITLPRDSTTATISITSAPARAPDLTALFIERAELTAGYVVSGAAGEQRLSELTPALAWAASVEVCLAGKDGAPPERVVCWPVAGAGQLQLLGFEADRSEQSARNEAQGTLAANLRARFGGVARVDAGLVVRMGEQTQDGVVPLDAGHCEGCVRQLAAYAGAAGKLFGEGVTISDGSLRFHATSKGGGKWEGGALVDGKVDALSNIDWPQLNVRAADRTVPLPGAPRPVNGRVQVTAAPGKAAEHRVTWRFSAHRLPLATASAVLGGTDALWSVPAVAEHVLSRDGTNIAWAAVETVAIASAATLVRPLPRDPKQDRNSFAPRYADRIVAGEFHGREPGMLRPGLGAVSTVFQGAMGAAFRSAYEPPAQRRLLIAGGFLGLLTWEDAHDAMPLLRLPVLAGLDVRLTQSAIGASELAWSDGAAARAVAVSRPTAPAPANVSSDALAAAMIAGALPRESGATTRDAAELAGALLVEQSFVQAPDAGRPILGTFPFFLAAAVSVDEVLRLYDKPNPVQSLSLVAAAIERPGRPPVGVAAAVAMRGLPPPQPDSPPEARWCVLGQQLTQWPWLGPRNEFMVPYLRAMAANLDPAPAAVLLSPDSEDAAYVVATIASPALDHAGVGRPAPASVADGGRGRPMAIGPAPLGWLAAPNEGAVAPIRDARFDGAAWTGSGLAGLARTIALPAAAGEPVEVVAGDSARAPAFVWLAQSRVPVYLPLALAGVRGGTLSWLQPAPPLVRLPVAADMASALLGCLPASGSAPHVQCFLPAELAGASIGERAGILTARRTRLLAPAADSGAFDSGNIRFGAPGQAGSSFTMKFRTPRPGPLPPNHSGDAHRNRRVQASAVQADVPVHALLGAADTVQGGPGNFDGCQFDGWAIELVAGAETASMVSELWDGSLNVSCRVHVRTPTKPAFGPASFVYTAFGLAPEATQAQLKVGEFMLPYQWVYPAAPVPDWLPAAAGATVQTGIVQLILDPRPVGGPASMPGVLSPLAEALNGPAGPAPVELQWTVKPRSHHAVIADAQTKLNTRQTPGLNRGSEERAPLTLRMPLYPVLLRYGALPLKPCSLVFNDPAYDRDLAGPPATDKKPITGATGADTSRGRLNLVLAADRPVINSRGVVTLMLDIAYERKLDPMAQELAEQAGVAVGGDLVPAQPESPAVEPRVEALLSMVLAPVTGGARTLKLLAPDKGTAIAALPLTLGYVYELPLALLADDKNRPVVLHPGDMLLVSAQLTEATFKLAHSATTLAAMTIADLKQVKPCLLPLAVTAEPVAEPPPALYFALQRTPTTGADACLAMPLHAQSPLPRRIDLADPARDFRMGMMRRTATFVWYLSSPASKLAEHSLTIIKSDRNGQGYWPVTTDEFASPVDLSLRRES